MDHSRFFGARRGARYWALATTLALVLPLLGPTPGQAQTAEEGRALYIEGDCDAALTLLRPLAEAGDANAQNVLGVAYDDGCGVPQDHAKALEWWEKSAAQGFARAEFNVGWFWEQDFDGFPADYPLAAEWYEKAAAQDYPEAFTNLGYLHASGRLGDPPDYTAARGHYVRGRALGSAQSINNLADLMREGQGGEVDLETAFRLYREAAAMQLPVALNNLGAMYRHGLGTETDLVAAYHLFLLAMNAGYAQAAVNLADLATFETGAYFYDPPYGHALCLYTVAAADEANREDFAAQCAEIEAAMTPEQLAEGRELQEGWE